MAAFLTACAPLGNRLGDRLGPAGAPGALRLAYADVLAPEAYLREGRAVEDPPGGAEGMWAATPGLARPERALLENLVTGAEAEVALFAGGGPDGAISLSRAAAAAIGLSDAGRVRLTALRREPRIADP